MIVLAGLFFYFKKKNNQLIYYVDEKYKILEDQIKRQDALIQTLSIKINQLIIRGGYNTDTPITNLFSESESYNKSPSAQLNLSPTDKSKNKSPNEFGGSTPPPAPVGSAPDSAQPFPGRSSADRKPTQKYTDRSENRAEDTTGVRFNDGSNKKQKFDMSGMADFLKIPKYNPLNNLFNLQSGNSGGVVIMEGVVNAPRKKVEFNIEEIKEDGELDEENNEVRDCDGESDEEEIEKELALELKDLLG
jgi:hypothetical protein